MNKKTFVIGSGPCANHLAKELMASGADVILATTDNAVQFPSAIDSTSIEILTDTKLLSCQGCVGDFKLVSDCRGQKITKNVAEIVIAVEDQRQPNFLLYGLKASSNIITLSQMKNILHDSSREKSVLSKIRKVVFLTGLVKKSTPVVAREVMLSSLLLQKDYTLQTYILTKNLKVAGHGLELLYRETKNAGTIYIKFTDAVPDIHQGEEDNIRIEFFDEITSKTFRLTPDLTVVDESIVPSRYAISLSKIFHIEKDVNGFVQADNVHRYSVLTNRKGIMVAGPSRSILTDDDQRIDAENSALAVMGQVSGETETKSEKAQVHEGQCIRCLTCYRLCPYHAIMLNTRVAVVPDACERCGICAAHCPRGAVRITDLEPGAVSDLIAIDPGMQLQKTFTPFIVAFCCRRSAAQALDLAICMGHRLPRGLKMMEVPCSGAVSYDHIFTALDNNADGVMVLTCHKGNCHSERGNIYAGQTVEQIQEMFSRIGFEKERLLIQTLASNMATEFAWIADRFEETILKLGPSRLKKNP